MPNPSLPHEELTDEHSQDDVDRDGQPSAAPVNFTAVFESSPDPYLVLAADPPRFTMGRG